ncbi:MAG: hypothetical protein ACOCQX_02270 [Candidatus Nanoarchaeia archaeon]
MEMFDNTFNSLANDLVKKNLGRVKRKNVLVLGFDSKEIEKASKMHNIKKIGKLFYKKRFDSSNFFQFAKKKNPELDLIFDIGFSSHLYKGELAAFYTYASRILGFKGRLYSVVPSAYAKLCRQRCPVRLWSYFEGQYTRFISEKELRHFIQANFRLETLTLHSNEQNSFFESVAVNDMKKIVN